MVNATLSLNRNYGAMRAERAFQYVAPQEYPSRCFVLFAGLERALAEAASALGALPLRWLA
eukprot:6471126-Pyramimonas_sp.AAC.1